MGMQGEEKKNNSSDITQWISSRIMIPTQTVAVWLWAWDQKLHVPPGSLKWQLWHSLNLGFQQAQPNPDFINVSWETKLWTQIGFLLKQIK